MGDSDIVSSMAYTILPIVFKSLHGQSNRRLHYLPLHMHGEEIVPTYFTLNIYIKIWIPPALTLTRLESYKIFINNKSVGLRGILHFPLLRDAYPDWLASDIPLNEGVP